MSSEPIVGEHSGWLHKRGGIRKNWLRRWFVLCRTERLFFIAYFAPSSSSSSAGDDAPPALDEHSTPKGVILMDDARVLTGAAADSKTGHRSSIAIHSPKSGREYSLYADGPEQIGSWAAKIEAAQTAWKAHVSAQCSSSSSSSSSDSNIATSDAPSSSSSSSSSSTSAKFDLFGSHDLRKELWSQYLLACRSKGTDREASSTGQHSGSGSGRAVFGADLVELMRRERGTGAALALPAVLEQLFAQLRGAYDQLGIFRLSPSRQAVEELAERWNAGGAVSLDGVDANVCAGLLKLFFRELREPLMTTALYSDFVKAQSVEHPLRQLAVMKALLLKLPPEHLFVLYKLCELLVEFDKHSDKSNMNVSNLAIVFTPNLFRLPELDMLRDIKDAPFLLSAMRTILLHFDLFFDQLISHDRPAQHRPFAAAQPSSPADLDAFARYFAAVEIELMIPANSDVLLQHAPGAYPPRKPPPRPLALFDDAVDDDPVDDGPTPADEQLVAAIDLFLITRPR